MMPDPEQKWDVTVIGTCGVDKGRTCTTTVLGTRAHAESLARGMTWSGGSYRVLYIRPSGSTRPRFRTILARNTRQLNRIFRWLRLIGDFSGRFTGPTYDGYKTHTSCGIRFHFFVRP